MTDPKAMNRLAALLEEACFDVAELMADAEESRADITVRALAIREKLGTVSRMAGLGELPEHRIRRTVERDGVKVS